MSEFNRLVEEQIPRLRRYARTLTRNPERADDLVQDALVRAVAKQDLWQPGTNLRAWLFTLMHNQHVNTVRRSAREGVVVDLEKMSDTLTATSDPTASRQLHELDRALNQLPEDSDGRYCLLALKDSLTMRPRQFSTCRSAPCDRACRGVETICAV